MRAKAAPASDLSASADAKRDVEIGREPKNGSLPHGDRHSFRNVNVAAYSRHGCGIVRKRHRHGDVDVGCALSVYQLAMTLH